jgi:hypothetical protein
VPRHPTRPGRSKRHSDDPFVGACVAPAARAFLAAISDDRVPQAVGFGLVVGRDLKGERLVVRELRVAVQSDAVDAGHDELDRQDIALLAIG